MYLTCFMQSSFYLLFLLDHHLYLLFLFYAFLFLLKFLFPFLRYFLHSFIFIFDLLSDFFHITFTFFFCVKHYTIAFILLKLIFICLPLSYPTIFFFSYAQPFSFLLHIPSSSFAATRLQHYPWVSSHTLLIHTLLPLLSSPCLTHLPSHSHASPSISFALSAASPSELSLFLPLSLCLSLSSFIDPSHTLPEVIFSSFSSVSHQSISPSHYFLLVLL